MIHTKTQQNKKMVLYIINNRFLDWSRKILAFSREVHTNGLFIDETDSCVMFTLNSLFKYVLLRRDTCRCVDKNDCNRNVWYTSIKIHHDVIFFLFVDGVTAWPGPWPTGHVCCISRGSTWTASSSSYPPWPWPPSTWRSSAATYLSWQLSWQVTNCGRLPTRL